MTDEQPQVRQRTRRSASEMLPFFGRGAEAAVEWAGLDKLTITFPASHLVATSDDVGEIVSDLSFRPYFRHKSNRRLTVRGARGDPKPLLGGSIAFKHDPQNRRYTCRITLRINITRIIAHLNGRRPSSIERGVLAAWLLAPDEDQRNRLMGMSLDANDNLLPDYRTWTFRSIRWGRELLFVARTLVEFIGNEIADAATGCNGVRFRRSWADWYISECEVYWEFRAPDALTQTRVIADRIERLAASVDRRLYVPVERRFRLADEDYEDTTEEVAEDGILRPVVSRRRTALEAVMEGGRQNVHLAVYAKTPERLRFEVRYLRKVRDFIPDGSRLDAGSNGAIASIPNMISTLIEADACQRMGMLFTALDELEVPVTTDTAGLPRLLAVLARICEGNEALLDDFVTSLCIHGCVYRDSDQNRRRAIERLVRRRVLRRAVVHPPNRGPTFVPTDEYIGAVEALRRAMSGLGEDGGDE